MTLKSLLEQPTQSPKFMFARDWTPADPEMNLTGTSFTWTNVNGTRALDYVGDRPAISHVGGGAATDGTTAQVVTPNCRVKSGQTLMGWWWVRGADIVTNDLCLGFLASTTTPFTDTTDFVMLRKLTSLGVFQLRCRKASGTAESTTLTMSTIAVDTWYEIYMGITGSSTAGAGSVEISINSAPSPGAGNSICQTVLPVATQMPDTVNIGLTYSTRVGGSSTTLKQYLGYLAEACRRNS